MDLNAKVPVRGERNKKQESLEVKSLTVDFLLMQERPERQEAAQKVEVKIQDLTPILFDSSTNTRGADLPFCATTRSGGQALAKINSRLFKPNVHHIRQS